MLSQQPPIDNTMITCTPKTYDDLYSLICQKYSFNLNKTNKMKLPSSRSSDNNKNPNSNYYPNCRICRKDYCIGVQLLRRCYTITSIHDRCSHSECTCEYTKDLNNSIHQSCLKCIIKILWVSSEKGMNSIGRFRSKCPFCKGEFCYLDIATYDFKRNKNNQNKNRINKSKKIRDRLTKQLKDFKKNKDLMEFSFPIKLNGFERKLVHDIAEKMELEHKSKGEGKNRYITVKKKA